MLSRLLLSTAERCSRSTASRATVAQTQKQRWYSARKDSREDSSKEETGQEKLLLVTQEEGVRRIVLDNGKKRNALSFNMMSQLVSALNDGEHGNNDDISSIVISSRGPVFSAGHDLAELRKPYATVKPKELFQLCSYLMITIQNLPIPVIAEVRGLATAAGCQLVASCDVAIASENAKFATPGVNIGLFCSTPSVAVTRAVPSKQAMHMLLTGEPITAHEALLHGLVSKVVPEAELECATKKVTDRLSSLSPDVIGFGKKVVYKQLHMSTEDAYMYASKAMAKNADFVDCQEGISAFLEKRLPQWKS